MILKAHKSISKKKSYPKKLIWIIGSVCLCVFLLFKAVYFIVSYTNPPQLNRIADAEAVVGQELYHRGFYTRSILTRTSKLAFEGNFSIKLLAPKYKFGFIAEIKDVRIGDEINAEVWVHAPNGELGNLVISESDKRNIYVKSNISTDTERSWHLLKVFFRVEDSIPNGIIKIHCRNDLTTPVYFDNLAYLHTTKTKVQWTPERIQLAIGGGEYGILRKKRDEAKKRGVLITASDSWVKGFIYSEQKEKKKIGISLRLKGDWTDHLDGNQWSFRIKTSKTKSWKRMKTFSLQHFRTRSGVKEWLLHQFLNREDILTTRFEFINMVVNNKNLGLYVYEEHFTKQLLEYSKRKEGPILKFSESYFWELYLQATQEGADRSHISGAFSPEILPFSESKTAASPILSAYFKTAQNLMFEYQYGLKSAKDIFDLDILAKYYAVLDITGGHHSATWHNQRFYYNPVTSKLEPIAFDGYANNADTWMKGSFIGENLCTKSGDKDWHKKLFSNSDFLKKYIRYLDQFSQKSYTEPFLDSLDQGLRDRVFYIKQMNKDYDFSANYIYQRTANIRNALKPLNSILQSKTIKPGLIAVCSRHKTGLEIVGTATTEKATPILLDSIEFVYTTTQKSLPDYTHQFEVPKEAKFLVYRVIGLDQLYYNKIGLWPVPIAFTAAQELESNLVTNHAAYYYHKESQRVVFKKEALVTSPIVIPKDHRVFVEEGTKIDLINKAFILSYSTVHFAGTERYPIEVNSSDGSANGIIVLQAQKRSKIEHTIFTNLNTLNYKGWNQTGAVTFYESDVDIYKSVFTKNYCEDALNIIRSNFTFDNNTISHTFADGFDADFCTGTVSNSYFYNTGNDGIDFSTSIVTIRDTKIENAGDKGISIGEAGKSTVINTQIDGAVIAIASKDLSLVTVRNTDIQNCEIGFAAYQKKPEYGGGKIYVINYTSKNLKAVHKILPGSYLKLVDKDIKGK
jgi:hypothetical protein